MAISEHALFPSDIYPGYADGEQLGDADAMGEDISVRWEELMLSWCSGGEDWNLEDLF